MYDDLLMFPIIGWEVTMVPSEGMICVRFPFLASPLEKLTEADPGKPHVMHAEQAREFRDALTRMIQRIDDYETKPRLSVNRAGAPIGADPLPISNA